MEALFEQALWLQQRGGAGADGAVSLLYQYATVQYVRWDESLVFQPLATQFSHETHLAAILLRWFSTLKTTALPLGLSVPPISYAAHAHASSLMQCFSCGSILPPGSIASL